MGTRSPVPDSPGVLLSRPLHEQGSFQSCLHHLRQPQPSTHPAPAGSKGPRLPGPAVSCAVSSLLFLKTQNKQSWLSSHDRASTRCLFPVLSAHGTHTPPDSSPGQPGTRTFVPAAVRAAALLSYFFLPGCYCPRPGQWLQHPSPNHQRTARHTCPPTPCAGSGSMNPALCQLHFSFRDPSSPSPWRESQACGSTPSAPARVSLADSPPQAASPPLLSLSAKRWLGKTSSCQSPMSLCRQRNLFHKSYPTKRNFHSYTILNKITGHLYNFVHQSGSWFHTRFAEFISAMFYKGRFLILQLGMRVGAG